MYQECSESKRTTLNLGVRNVALCNPVCDHHVIGHVQKLVQDNDELTHGREGREYDYLSRCIARSVPEAFGPFGYLARSGIANLDGETQDVQGGRDFHVGLSSDSRRVMVAKTNCLTASSTAAVLVQPPDGYQ